MESKKIQQASEYNKNEVDSDMENKLVVTSGGGGAIKGWGRRRYKLLHVK